MIDFYIERQLINTLKTSLDNSSEALNITNLQKERDDLVSEQHQEGFWQNIEKAQINTQRAAQLTKQLERVSSLYNQLNSTLELSQMIEELDDESEALPLRQSLSKLKESIESLAIECLLRGKYDSLDAILTLHAGAGGTEAQDWVEMLYRMYCRYAERIGYGIKELDYLDGEEAGIKSVTFQLCGNNAYGYLKAEKGVHRLVRISPFDSNKRRHTSFASLEVMPLIIETPDIKIDTDDLRIDTYRSGGAGGQHVNKTDSAVRITHLPSGIVVQCQNERSQIQNRETAYKMLLGKLVELKEREHLQEASDIKGDLKKIEWGSQIRSYVFCPYTLVKDHRTGAENSNVGAVMDGDIQDFIIEYLKRS